MKIDKIKYPIYILVAILFLWSFFTVVFFFQKDKIDRIGQFGDSFGMLNTLFSGLAFGALVYTIFLQHEELKLTREELKLTRKELGKSANAQAETQKALNQANINQMKIFKINESNVRKDHNLNLLNITFDRLLREYNLIQHTFFIGENSEKLTLHGYRAMNKYLSEKKDLENGKYFNSILISDYKFFLVNYYNLISLTKSQYDLHPIDKVHFLRTALNFYVNKIQGINKELKRKIGSSNTNREVRILTAIKATDKLMEGISANFKAENLDR